MKGPLLVAVVDDDESVRESLPDLLREFGFAVEAFASAQSFLSASGLQQIRCLILDVLMPGMSGADLLQALQACGNAMPVILVTANTDACRDPRLQGAGVVDCLAKPFSEAQLLKALSAALPVG
ncbi:MULTISPECIES: response regulator transcription factor [Pseudomonas]|uniref:DNA-binding response regulator n=1 Tax=Pseudomonas putida TaxID=303 RepID=A0AAD0L6R6_PSEPU|nr:response regulator [Pseudomonas putida]AXA24761.1 DNA-binding response regulator [Pseudomonas putida]MBH3458318.1 response regulator [Pseudomonas putida]